MRYRTMLALFLVALSPTGAVHALDDSRALSGLAAVTAIYDVRTKDEKKLQFIFTVIRDTLDETEQQGVKTRYIVSMRGPTVKLLISSGDDSPAASRKTITLIEDLNKRGVRLEACGYALNLFGLEASDLYGGIHAVGNSLNSLIGYQTQGYVLVPMN